MKRDLLGIVEAAYLHADTTEAWRARLVDAAGVLDRGLGVVIALAAYSADEHITYTKVVGTGTPSLLGDFATAGTALSAASVRRSLASSGKTASMFLGPALSRLATAVMNPNGAADCLGLHGIVGKSRTIGLYVPLPKIESVEARAVRRFRLLGVHLGAAWRGAEGGPSADEAWLEPSGRVVDATGGAAAARAELSVRVRAIEAARMRQQRADIDGGLSVWKGLVAGKWSLVERFESDGRRFLVARRNAPKLGRQLRLTRREATVAKLVALGQSQKLVAYTLGLSPAMVSVHLASAMMKLRVRTRGELMAMGGLLSSG